MKSSIFAALQLTLIGETQKLRQAHSQLSTLSENNGFCIALMEIVDEQNIQIPIKQAALIQLKNHVERHWKPKKKETLELSIDQKNLIKNSLVTAVIRCAKVYKLIKLYREIITTIVRYEFREWLPIQEMVNWLDKNENIEPVMQCFIAIASNFQFCIAPKDRAFYNQLLLFLLPKILQVIKNNPDNSELVYLSVKFFWKSIHYDLSKQGKILCLDWMEFLYNIIVGYNQYHQTKLDEFLPKYCLQFYYFHSKKWATRSILRFLQKHAKNFLYGQQIVDNKQFTIKWHETYGGAFLKAIVEQQKVPTIKKVRYFQLKCLNAWTTEKPGLMKQYASVFQYEILPNNIRLKPEDEQLANSDPIEYLTVEEESILSFTNLKRASVDLWIALAQMQSQTENGSYIPGIFFQDNLNYLFQYLKKGNPLEKQFAMHMLCEMSYVMTRAKESINALLQLFPQYIIPQFQNPITFLRMRANDLFIHFGKTKMDMGIIEKAAEGIYTCLSSDSSPIVRIKAATAFHSILVHQNAKALVKPMLQNILEVYLKLIEAYDLEQLVKGLECIVEDFAQDIGPYAIDLFKYLSQLFIKLFEKDMQQSKNSDQYEGEIEQAAAGCLKAMSQIVDAPLSEEIRKSIQENVLQICYFVLCQQSVDYSEDILHLLNSHLFKATAISPQLWFFFQVIIYFLIGIPREFWDHLNQVQMPEKNKKLLMNLRDSDNSEYYQHAMLVIRNYIAKGAKFVNSQNEAFKDSFVKMLFHLISETYKMHDRDVVNGEVDLDCATIMMVYMVENYRYEVLVPFIPLFWNYSNYNLHKSRTSFLRAITSQLLGVLFWKVPVDFLNILDQAKSLEFALVSMVRYQHHLEETYQRKRLILGILSLLMISEKPTGLLNQAPVLFTVLLKIIQNSSRETIIKFMEKKKIKSEEMGINWNEDFQQTVMIPNDDEVQYEEQQDYWDESFYLSYNDPLNSINEFASFQECMVKLQQNQTAFFQTLLQTTQQKKLVSINDDIIKAIQILKQQNN